MNEKDIVNFRNQIKDFSVEELKEKRNNLQNDLSKMILNSDIIEFKRLMGINADVVRSMTISQEEKEGK